MVFGFSYVGVIFLVMLFIPNIIWVKNKPEDYDKYSKKENKILLIFERTGEVLACSIVAFSGCNVRPRSIWLGWLILTLILMILYECYWIRYFKSEKKMSDMYSSFAGFPVAGASLPVFALLFLGIYACNLVIIVTSVILGVGHIGIHLAHRNEVAPRVKKSKVRLVIKTIILIPVVIILLLLSVIIAFRNVNYYKCVIDTSKGIDEESYIDINGQKQFITIRGRDKNAPVVLYLHGGPGSPDSFCAYNFTNEMIDEYTVVCWDQRGCGRTYVMNDDKENKTVSFDQALDDLNVLVDYLIQRFGQEKISIMGHSYGTVLGTVYAYNFPEKIEVYIGLGQFVSADTSAEAAYKDAVWKSWHKQDTTALTAAYENYKKDKNIENYSKVVTEASKFYKNKRERNIIFMAITSPRLSSEDLIWYSKMTSLDAFMKYQKSLVDYMMTVDVSDNSVFPKFLDIPTLYISGNCDCNCAYEDMVLYSNVSGGRYELIEGCGHNVQYDAPEEVAQIVKDYLGFIIYSPKPE